jgi:hypothetical protein
MRVLNVSNCNVGDDGALLFSEMLRKNHTLRELVLRNNKITRSSADFVCTLSLHNDSLLRLDLQGNDIALADLRDIDLLTRLNAQHRQLKQHVLELYANCTRLTELNLCESEASGHAQYRYAKRYGDPCIQLLCDALKGNTVLTSMNATANNITDAGAQYIADMLLQNNTLTSIQLDYNAITDAGFQLITKSLYKNTSIVMISSDHNPIHPETRRQLNEAVHSKKNGSELSYERLQVQQFDSESDRERLIDDQILNDALQSTALSMCELRYQNPHPRSTTSDDDQHNNSRLTTTSALMMSTAGGGVVAGEQQLQLLQQQQQHHHHQKTSLISSPNKSSSYSSTGGIPPQNFMAHLEQRGITY